MRSRIYEVETGALLCNIAIYHGKSFGIPYFKLLDIALLSVAIAATVTKSESSYRCLKSVKRSA